MFNYKLNGIIVAALLGKKFNDQSGPILNALIFGYELTYESEYYNLQLLSDNIFVCIKDKTEHTAKRWQDFFGKITQLDRNVFEDTSSTISGLRSRARYKAGKIFSLNSFLSRNLIQQLLLLTSGTDNSTRLPITCFV